MIDVFGLTPAVVHCKASNMVHMTENVNAGEHTNQIFFP